MTCEAFPLPLNVSVADNGRTVTLISPVIYVDPALSLAIEVPEGFETDFNSIPRLFWWFLAPWEFPEAGVVHDYLYQLGRGVRADADHIHRRALINLGCGAARAWLVWAALRCFGWLPGNWDSAGVR